MHWFYRATIDFTVFDEETAKRLKRSLKDPFADERLAHQLNDLVMDGKVELDAIRDIEAHGKAAT